MENGMTENSLLCVRGLATGLVLSAMLWGLMLSLSLLVQGQ
jgi:hypothetical protein